MCVSEGRKGCLPHFLSIYLLLVGCRHVTRPNVFNLIISTFFHFPAYKVELKCDQRRKSRMAPAETKSKESTVGSSIWIYYFLK